MLQLATYVTNLKVGVGSMCCQAKVSLSLLPLPVPVLSQQSLPVVMCTGSTFNVTLGLTQTVTLSSSGGVHWPDPDGVGLSALQYPFRARSG